MKPMRVAMIGLIICTVAVGHNAATRGESSSQKPPGTGRTDSATVVETSGEKSRAKVEKARDRAEQLHETYEATLEMLHHRYFHRDRSLLPARAMEDIFADMKRRTNVEAKWISINTKAMNIDHEPKSEFEKEAAREIAAGKPAFERIGDDVYRRATAIPLKSGCVSCHAGAFAATSKTPRFAGLVISVPLDGD